LGSLPQAEKQLRYDLFVHGRVSDSIFAFDLIHAHLTEAERNAFCVWALTQHVRKILEEKRPTYYKHPGANLTYGKILSAIHAALAILGEPGLPQLDGELAELISFFEATLNVAISSDGWPEEDGGYGTAFLCFMYLAAEALLRAGLFDAFRASPRLARSGQAMLHVAQPWWTHLATTGDCGGSFGARQYILPSLARATGDPTLLWLYGAARDSGVEIEIARNYSVPADALSLITLDLLGAPVHPRQAGTPTAFRDRRRGFVTFRSGWNEDDTFVVFDGSQRTPGAQGHFHASCGHFSISALGEYFAIDTGRYNMEQDQHNLVLVDGKSGRSTNGEWTQMTHHGNLIDYLPGDLCDFAAVDSSHQHDCYWARRYLGLVKGKDGPAYVWTVEDINKANDYREFWWTLNTSPANTIKVNRDQATIHGSRHGNLLDVSFVLPDPSAYPKSHTLSLTQDMKTCGSYKYIGNPYARAKTFKNPEEMVLYSAFVRPRLIAKVKGYNGRFLSVMIPRCKGRQPARIERLASLDNSLAVKINFPKVEDILIFAYEHNLLEAGGMKGRGQWCLVRRSRKSGKVLAQASGTATGLSIR
jgi:hypothetical protein